MLAATIGRMGMAALLLAMVAGACGDSGGDDDRACHECSTNESCDGDQECALAVDGELRCFDVDKASCTIGRVEVARAPTPTPQATP
ncbi:MAG: hypothetical protein IT294_01140 [Deltaproteobacteria bacterium]|nr:hypothetical protein [Deltaproteobacteria bacterium]